MKLSIIIPTCNEEEYIAATLATIFKYAILEKPEVIVVDCGSTDSTVAIASQKPVRVLVEPSFAGCKYKSLNAGAKAASGNVLLFLDADSLLPVAYDASIQQALLKRNVVGGAFEFDFDQHSFSLNCVILINRIRYRFRKRFYGDQGIFVNKDAFLKANGWPALAIMEAAHFCKKLQQYGRLHIIRKPVKTSARRFVEGGVWRVFFHDIRIWAMDLLGMDVQHYASNYWKENQTRGFKAFESAK